MKKLFISLMLMAVPVMMFAQLKVMSDGTTYVKHTVANPNAYLTVDNRTYSSYGGYNIGIVSGSRPTLSTNFNVGLMSDAYLETPSSQGRTYGVVATAGNATNGYNYGVFGILAGSKYGAGVVGSVGTTMGINILGTYAGYFNGSVYVNGFVMATTYLNPSDMRLKENVTFLKSDAKSPTATLDKVLSMNPIRYNYIDRPEEVSDTATVVEEKEKPEKKQVHYGLSAQELQEIYPDLVYEGQDGYLSVNYTELVPILIRSIQELKQEVDELKGESASRSSNNVFSEDDAATKDSSIGQTLRNTASLKQNTPNPFSERTVISFTLPEDAKNANICIFDMSGKMLKQLPVTPAMQSVTINGYELAAGMYIYSLVIGGKEIESKRMILSK